MKSTFRFVGGLLLVAILFAGLTTLTVSAQGPTTPTPTTSPPSEQTPAAAPPAVVGTTMDSPLNAGTLGGSLAAIPSGPGQWFKFNYDTNGNAFPRPVASIRLLNGVTNGLGFEVWAPEQIQGNWWEQKPVGRGTPESLPGTACLASTNQPFTPGSSTDIAPDTVRNCQTNDLTWTGGFGAPGTYFVHLINTGNNDNAMPQLILSGTGIAECQTGSLPQVADQIQTGTGQGFSLVQCQDPTHDQLLSLNTQNLSQGQTDVPAAAPTLSAIPTAEGTTAAPTVTTEASPTVEATATTAAPSTPSGAASPTAEATATSSSGATPAATATP